MVQLEWLGRHSGYQTEALIEDTSSTVRVPHLDIVAGNLPWSGKKVRVPLRVPLLYQAAPQQLFLCGPLRATFLLPLHPLEHIHALIVVVNWPLPHGLQQVIVESLGL
jgi:hypothetical protein